jgi:hypothetical protein
MGFGTQGLPMSLSLMARPYEEGRLIGYVSDYEQATKQQRPSPLVPPLSARRSPATNAQPNRPRTPNEPTNLVDITVLSCHHHDINSFVHD